MKKLLIPALFALSLSASAQQHLPDTIRLKLNANQVLAMSAKIDSLQNLLTLTSTLPSGQVAQFNMRANVVFQPMFDQIRKQLVAERPKEGKK